MLMKQHVLSIILAASIASMFTTGANADVASDIAMGLPVDQIILNAQNEGTSLSSTIIQIIQIDFDLGLQALILAVQALPEQAATLAALAAAAVPDMAPLIALSVVSIVPDSAPEIAKAVKQAVPGKDADIDIAISTGTLPSNLANLPNFDEAPAAGSSTPAAPTSVPVPPPALGGGVVTPPTAVSPS